MYFDSATAGLLRNYSVPSAITTRSDSSASSWNGMLNLTQEVGPNEASDVADVAERTGGFRRTSGGRRRYSMDLGGRLRSRSASTQLKQPFHCWHPSELQLPDRLMALPYWAGGHWAAERRSPVGKRSKEETTAGGRGGVSPWRRDCHSSGNGPTKRRSLIGASDTRSPADPSESSSRWRPSWPGTAVNVSRKIVGTRPPTA